MHTRAGRLLPPGERIGFPIPTIDTKAVEIEWIEKKEVCYV